MADVTLDPAVPFGQRAGALILWTVYRGPPECPAGYMARRHVAQAGRITATEATIVTPDLEALRETLRSNGLVCLGRTLEDPDNVLETWC